MEITIILMVTRTDGVIIITDNLETIVTKGKEREYKDGLPFTVDHKRMVSKSIKSRFKDPNQYVHEFIKLALENSESYVKVTSTDDRFSVEFDGNNIATKEELAQVRYRIFNKDTTSEHLGRLGSSLIAALAIEPYSVTFEGKRDDKTLLLEMDADFDGKPVDMDYSINANRLTIVKKDRESFYEKTKEDLKKAVKKKRLLKESVKVLGSGLGKAGGKVFNGMGLVFESIVGLNNINGLYEKYVNRTLENLVSYEMAITENLVGCSQKDVTFNGKKLSTHMEHLDSFLFKEYKVNDSTIMVSIPNTDDIVDHNTRITWLKNNIPIGYEDKVLQNGYAPNVIVNNDRVNTNISGEIIEDSIYSAVKDDIRKAINMFKEDLSLGDIEFRDIELKKGLKDYETARKFRVYQSKAVMEAFNRGNIKDKLMNYHSMGEDFYETIPFLDEREKLKRYFSKKIFRDVSENEYTLPDIYKYLHGISGDGTRLEIGYTLNDINLEHFSLRGIPAMDNMTLFFRNTIEQELFKDIFNLIYKKGEYVRESVYDANSGQFLHNADLEITGIGAQEEREIDRMRRRSSVNSGYHTISVNLLDLEHIIKDANTGRKNRNLRIAKDVSIKTGVGVGTLAVSYGLGTLGYNYIPMAVSCIVDLSINHPSLPLSLAGVSTAGTLIYKGKENIVAGVQKSGDYAVKKISDSYRESSAFRRRLKDSIVDTVEGIGGRTQIVFDQSINICRSITSKLPSITKFLKRKVEEKPIELEEIEAQEVEKEDAKKSSANRSEDVEIAEPFRRYFNCLVEEILFDPLLRSNISDNGMTFKVSSWRFNRLYKVKKGDNLDMLYINTRATHHPDIKGEDRISDSIEIYKEMPSIFKRRNVSFSIDQRNGYKIYFGSQNSFLFDRIKNLTMEAMVGEYVIGDPRLLDHFSALREESKKQVAREILQIDERDSYGIDVDTKGRKAIDDSLFKDHNKLFFDVSVELNERARINDILNSVGESQIEKGSRNFESLTYKEKLFFIEEYIIGEKDGYKKYIPLEFTRYVKERYTSEMVYLKNKDAVLDDASRIVKSFREDSDRDFVRLLKNYSCNKEGSSDNFFEEEATKRLDPLSLSYILYNTAFSMQGEEYKKKSKILLKKFEKNMESIAKEWIGQDIHSISTGDNDSDHYSYINPYNSSGFTNVFTLLDKDEDRKTVLSSARELAGFKSGYQSLVRTIRHFYPEYRSFDLRTDYLKTFIDTGRRLNDYVQK